MNKAQALILLPRLRVQNANAISGPLTWGFPSPTAFTGFVHALQRKLATALGGEMDVRFGGVGIVCHHFEPQINKPNGVYKPGVFQLSRNPINQREDKSKIDKVGNITPASIVGEGRVHLEVSLVFSVLDYLDEEDTETVMERLNVLVHQQRLAGGSILPQRAGKRYRSQYWPLAMDKSKQDETFRKFRRQLLPGFALVQRDKYLKSHLQNMRATNAQANALDALLDLSRINYEPVPIDSKNPEPVEWKIRKRQGWLVPLPVGYASISPLYNAGTVANVRDEKIPFRFVESLYSLGQWLSPHRLNTLDQLLWHYSTDVDQGIYRCVNGYENFINS